MDNLSTRSVLFESVYVCLLATYELAYILSFFVSNFSDLRTPKTAGHLAAVDSETLNLLEDICKELVLKYGITVSKL